MTEPLRVVLADDSALFRRGLELLLSAAGVEVIAAVDSVPALTDCLAARQPDVVVVDVRMPPSHTDEGIRAAVEIRRQWPSVGVCVLSTYVEPVWAVSLLEEVSDGVGYLLKDRVDDVGALLAALRRVADGGVALDPEVVVALVAKRRRTSTLSRLTDKELAVLTLLAEGKSNAGIAAELFVSSKTVEGHVASIFRALDLDNIDSANRRVQAALAFLNNAS